MKYLVLTFMLVFSVTACAANKSKKESAKAHSPVTEKPRNDQVTQLDDLMRGEMAAMKAYDQAISDIKNEKQKSTLQQIRKDHEKAVSAMSKYVAGKPDLLSDTEEAGPWGTFAKAWTKTRSLTGNEGALKALRQGEEHGIKEYEEALKDENIPNELKQMIKTELLPNQKKHIETLKTIM